MKNILHVKENKPDISLGRKKSLSSSQKELPSSNGVQEKLPHITAEGTPSDNDLIARFREKGDTKALVMLLNKYERYIVSIALPILKSPEDAKDLKQDLYIKLADSFTIKAPNQRFKSWLGTVVKNYCIDKYRKFKRMTGDEELPEPSVEDWRTLNLNMDFQRVQACVEELNPEQQIYIELAFFKKMKNQAIAEYMNWTPNKTRGTRDRALKKLKQSLKGFEGELAHYFQED
ncbi:MAG: sigma-70 family RNA polymerase sigma factor [Bacteroidota bacterium]